MLDGFVITTAATQSEPITTDPERLEGLRRASVKLTNAGTLPVAERSSSIGEGTETSSTAGQFLSALHVSG